MQRLSNKYFKFSILFLLTLWYNIEPGDIMKYRNIFDTHTHSVNSFDGHHSCKQLCEGIIKNNGIGIAITDHCDIDGMKDDCWSFQDKQFNEVLEAKAEFQQITVFNGVELGQGLFEKELSEKFLSAYDFDFVLGSVHNLKNMEDFYFLDYKQCDIYSLLQQYFNALLDLVKWNQTDSLAHLTYPLRYIVAREKINVDMSKFNDIIEEIFDTVIKNEKAIELNVSGLSMDMNDTLPNKKYIKKFHDMGGKYVTVGSDSHYFDKVCNNIDKGYDILKECGFDSFTIFEKRQPKLITIE